MIHDLYRHRTFFSIGAAAITYGLLGCSASEYQIEVRATYPDDVALANLEITVLPFDREALRDSIAATSETPRPLFPDLETQLASYAPPDLAGLAESFLPWQAIHDSVQHLADSLSAVGADSSPRYAAAYARLRSQYQRLAQSSVTRDAAIQEQVGDDKELAMWAAAAADSLRAWERVAFADLPNLVDSLMAREDRGFHIGTTDHEGIVEFTLTPGRWWIVATSAEPENPFGEYHWNVGIVVRRFGSKSIPLFAGNGNGRWRY